MKTDAEILAGHGPCPAGRSKVDHLTMCRMIDTIADLRAKVAGEPDGGLTGSPSVFVQIAAAGDGDLYALDGRGGVWRYCPEVKTGTEKGVKTRFAFWSKLTGHRSDPADSPSRTRHV